MVTNQPLETAICPHTLWHITMMHVGPSHPPFHSAVDILSACRGGWVGLVTRSGKDMNLQRLNEQCLCRWSLRCFGATVRGGMLKIWWHFPKSVCSQWARRMLFLSHGSFPLSNFEIQTKRFSVEFGTVVSHDLQTQASTEIHLQPRSY